MSAATTSDQPRYGTQLAQATALSLELCQLCTQLRDLAFILDREGSHAAVDLAVTVAQHLNEITEAHLLARS